MGQDHAPRHDRCDLSIEIQSLTQIQEGGEISLLEHPSSILAAERLVRIVFGDLRMGWTRCHERMATRVTFGLGRATHKKLHMVHTGTFETMREGACGVSELNHNEC